MSAARGRPGSAAPSSCRSRTARAAPGTCRRARRRSRSISGVDAAERLADALVADVHQAVLRTGRSRSAHDELGRHEHAAGGDAGPSAIASSTISAAMPPISSASWRTVVRSIRRWRRDRDVVEADDRDIVSGTRRPRRSSRSISAIAITSLVQQTAVGPSSMPAPARGRGAASAAAAPRAGGRSTPRARRRVRERDPLWPSPARCSTTCLHRRVLVDVDDAQARVVGLERDDDHRDAAVEQLRRDRRARRHGREDDAVDAAADERPHLVGLGVAGRSRSRRRARRSRRGGRAARPGRATVAWNGLSASGMTTPERLRRPPLERARDLVLAVAELVDRLQHARRGSPRRPGRCGAATFDTVATETPDLRATSCIVIVTRPALPTRAAPPAASRATSRCPPRASCADPRARSRRRRRTPRPRSADEQLGPRRRSSWPRADGGEVPRGRVGVDREAASR